MIGAIAVVESLTDFVSSEDLGKKKQSSGNCLPKYSRGKGFGSEQRKKSSHKRAKLKRQGPKPNGCFLCGGPHMVRKCPQKQALIALTTSIHPPKSDKGKAIALSLSSSESSSDDEEYKDPGWEQYIC